MDNSFSTTCAKCGRKIYEGEMLNIKGRYVCEDCAGAYIFEGKVASPKRRRVPSAFFHFCCSMIPGAGHMYLGLMKKGLFQMCLFYFCIYLTTFIASFGFVIPIIWIYSFFDSIALRRKLVNGDDLSDDLYNEKMFFNRNMALITIAVILLLVVSAVTAIFGTAVSITSSKQELHRRSPERYIERQLGDRNEVTAIYIDRDTRSLTDVAKPILLIGLGGLIVYNVMKRRKSDDKGDSGKKWELDKTGNKGD